MNRSHGKFWLIFYFVAASSVLGTSMPVVAQSSDRQPLALDAVGQGSEDTASDASASAGESNAGESNAGESNAGESNAGESNAGESNAGVPSIQQNNQCLACHANDQLMVGELQRLLVTTADLASDIHWQKGLSCHECHGGDPAETNFLKAHSAAAGFRPVSPVQNIPEFCGHCHSDPQYMRNFSPSLRTDQAAIYWTSGHGQKLKEGDQQVAHCVSCHGGMHNLKSVNSIQSPVYPPNVANMCGQCHSDPEKMAGRTHKGKPMVHNQVEKWKNSVHARLLLEEEDLSAPTCNDCHGNHGALAPEIGSVANVCGTCHVKIAELFAGTRMKHRFEEVDLPGCATCHGNHEIKPPTDEMLGMMGDTAVCNNCHNEGQFGATFIGGQVATELRGSIENLKERIASVETRLDYAERLGMEIREPRFELRAANDALQNARTVIHSFSTDVVTETIGEGEAVCEEVEQAALNAIAEYTNRRIWLGLSLLPIFLVIGLLLIYIRSLPPPKVAETGH